VKDDSLLLVGRRVGGEVSDDGVDSRGGVGAYPLRLLAGAQDERYALLQTFEVKEHETHVERRAIATVRSP